MTGTYCAPARQVLTELHITDVWSAGETPHGDIPPGTVLRCGRVTEAGELWWPTFRGNDEPVCKGCTGQPAETQAALL